MKENMTKVIHRKSGEEREMPVLSFEELGANALGAGALLRVAGGYYVDNNGDIYNDANVGESADNVISISANKEIDNALGAGVYGFTKNYFLATLITSNGDKEAATTSALALYDAFLVLSPTGTAAKEHNKKVLAEYFKGCPLFSGKATVDLSMRQILRWIANGEI